MSAIQPHQAATPVIKAIPSARDRLQSRLLVAIALPVLCWVTWNAVDYARPAGHSGRLYLYMAGTVSAFFGLAAWRLGAATPAAGACGALICFDITVLSGRPDGGSVLHSGLSPLILLFVLTHAATRFRQSRKQSSQRKEHRGRNAAQVIANLGIAAFVSLEYFWIFPHPPRGAIQPFIFPASEATMIAALAEATADTVSSEVGQAIGGRPYLLPGFRSVEAGTDGAISAIGTMAGIGAASVVALAGIPALGFDCIDVMHVIFAAMSGFFLDSLLGATLERRGWIGNDGVNFASTFFAAAVYVLANPIVFA
ncbi:MAG TPA: DUF92 domain-containing protein [Acidobacteriaceae bacterium]|jgi:uncharacterized protein (TIGR00297 family)|nr:DUF92 domain-containing protein [Acidobacteriaceae bacterium]